MADTLDSTGKYVPKDLQITSQPDAVDKDKFKVVVNNLKIDSSYAFQFQYVYPDGELSEWSPGVNLNTSTETVPSAPSVTVPSTSTGSIPVTLSSYPSNAKRVDIYVIGGEFGAGKVADYFLAAGTKSIAVAGGTYQVSLITVTPSGINGNPTNTFTITVSTAGETIQAPTNPNGFSAKKILGGIEVTWDGTYSNGTFTGFEAVKIYVGNSATATIGTYKEAGVLSSNNVKNTINVAIDGTYLTYGQTVYIHAAAVNKNGTVGTIQPNVASVIGGAGKATDADINDGAVVISKLASNVLYVDNLKAGTLSSSSYIRSGNKSGARIEISSATSNITTETDPITGTTSNLTYPVKPGITIYGTNGTTELLRADYSGNLSITGSGTFSGALSGATGTFSGDISASNGLFSVSNGILTAQAGTIGNWKINSTQIRSNGANQISLNPSTPKISLIQGAALNNTTGLYEGGTEKITIDPVQGIKDSAGNFTLTPDGILTINGTITAGSTITGPALTITGNTTSYSALATTNSKISFSASNYAIAGGSSTWSYSDYNNPTGGYYDSNGDWVTTYSSISVTNNDARFTDITYGGAVPPSNSGFSYGELWLGSGSTYGTIDLWANYPGSYIGISMVANASEQNMYIYGKSSSGFTTSHMNNGTDNPALLQVDTAGKLTRGRAILTGSATTPNSGWGLLGDLYFSTAT